MKKTSLDKLDRSDPDRAPAASDDPGPLRVSSATLLHGGRELLIDHGRREYRLRVTASGKLILTA